LEVSPVRHGPSDQKKESAIVRKQLFIQAIKLAKLAHSTMAGRGVPDAFGGGKADLAALGSG